MKTAELLQSMSEGQVKYVLVGGLAVQRFIGPKDQRDIVALEKIKRGVDPNV